MTIVSPWSRATCPFCFERFHLAEAPRRISRHGAEKEADPFLQRFLSLPTAPEMSKTVPAPARPGVLQRCFIGNDARSQTRRICPHCHLNLPNAIASGHMCGETIAIIGARSSGKSNFFGVLIHALQRRFCAEVGFTMYDQQTFSVREMAPITSLRLYRERYAQRLFHASTPMAIDQTDSARVNVSTRIPLIFRLEFDKRLRHRITSPLTRRNAVDLSIFDAAGEDMNDPATLEHFYRYVSRAAGIIFLIDPFQYPGIRNRLPEPARRRIPMIDTDPAEVVSNVINLFEQDGLAPGKQIQVPAAFAFAKADLFDGVIHRSSRLLRDSRHLGGFNTRDCQRVSDEVKECIKEWDSPQLVRLAEGKFANHSFFALSALGELPDKDLRLKSVTPRRIADPLLWLLWQRGHIPAAERT